MARRFHAVCFIVSRAALLPDFLSEGRRKKWFAGFCQAVETMSRDGIGEAPAAFISRVGRLLPEPPRRTYAAQEYPDYPHSRIPAAPYYVRSNWRIKAAALPFSGSVQFRMRLRFYAHGAASCALFGQLHSEPGATHEELVTFLRGLVDSGGRAPLTLSWSAAGESHVGRAGDLMDQALLCLPGALLKSPKSGGLQKLEPDHLTVDLGRATPALSSGKSDRDLLRILALTTEQNRRIVHKREPDLGLFESDWVAASTKHLLFCNTKTPWPQARRWRSMRRHARLIWQLYKVAEVARTRLLWARHLAQTFEASSLEMTRAQNVSKNFVMNLLKATYYDDRLYTLAADLKDVGELHSRDARLYDHLAGLTGLDKELSRLEAAAKGFISQVGSWSPGIGKFVDLFKVIPKP
jgi:hypothetical protein